MAEVELRQIRRRVTMVFQSGALFDSLTVGENILFSLETREDYDEQNREDDERGAQRDRNPNRPPGVRHTP